MPSHPVPPELRSPNDDWTAITSKEERKKRQDRLNQRAKRRRNAKETPTEKRPYRVERWRLTESDLSLRGQPQSLSTDRSALNDLDERLVQSTETQDISLNLVSRARSDYQVHSPWTGHRRDYPLSLDHLIPLIHQNVFRALMTNKALLNANAILIKAQPDLAFWPPSHVNLCDGLTLIRPVEQKTLPLSLYPTSLQMSLPHSSMIKMFPFPCFRDNLVKWETIVDTVDLCFDLFWRSLHKHCLAVPLLYDVTARRRGLIVWGESYDPEAWEVTPGFLTKWAWLLEGCHNLIEASNRWRAMRGEGPLRLESGVEFRAPSGQDDNPYLSFTLHITKCGLGTELLDVLERIP